MKQRIPQDDIDRELSRIFFGKKNESPDTLPEKKPDIADHTLKNIPINKKKSLKPAGFLAGFISITVVVAGIYLLGTDSGTVKTEKAVISTDEVGETLNDHASTKAVSLSQEEISNSRGIYPDILKNVKQLYSFENSMQEWEIPSWSSEKDDYAAVALKHMKGFASEGTGSLELTVNFPGGSWSGAIIEIQQYLSFEDFGNIAVDIYIPNKAPQWIRGKIILTTGETWAFTEMTRGTRLKPGAWTTVSADLSDKSPDWKKIVMSGTIRHDIRKIAIRVESDKTPYFGPVYIDNVRLGFPVPLENKRYR